MNRLLPKSLAGRLIALLLLALIVSQGVALAIFSDERRHAVRSAHREQILARAASVILLLKETPSDLHERIVDAASTRNLKFWLSPESAAEPAGAGGGGQWLGRRLARHLGEDAKAVLVEVSERDGPAFRWPGRHWFAARRDKGDRSQWRPIGDGARPKHRDPAHRDHAPWHRRGAPKELVISIQPATGRWLNATVLAPPPPPGWAWPSLLSMAVMALFITAIVILMVRRIARPMQRLARASDDLGRGDSPSPLPEEGPEELRSTTRAFNRMSERLQRFVQDRTRMLAAMSHDLRTPITTLRLRAEFVEDEETRQKILATLDEMQAIAEAVLAFAREDAAREDTRKVDLAALVGSLCDDLADLGHEAAFAESEALTYPCRPVSLKRAIRNLVENAATYGKRARVRLESGSDSLRLVIEDEGPGIPDDQRAEVFEPFVRLESSRSRATGGIGLGMAIARSIVRSHGGDIALENRAEGGLRVIVSLPREPARSDQSDRTSRKG